MIRKLYYRLFVCGQDGHVLGTMKAAHYGGQMWDRCVNCGTCVTPKKWRR